jgi:hypothetical protein
MASTHAFFEQEGEAKEVYTGITLRLKLDDQTNIDIPLVADRWFRPTPSCPTAIRWRS